MELNTIKDLYNLLTVSDNIFDIRHKLHNLCDKVDFDNLSSKYLKDENVTRMINYIKKEYDKMIAAEKTIYKISDEELNIRIDKLKLVRDIFNTYNNPYIRVDKLSKLFKNPNIMLKSYKLLVKYGKDDPKLDDIRPLLNNFDTYYHEFRDNFGNDIGKFVNYSYKNEEEKDIYNYASFVINDFINNDSLTTDDFLNKYGINKDILNYLLGIIKRNNRSLYFEYVIKNNENEKLENNMNMFIIDDLFYAVNNGVFVYGNRFDTLEFIKYIPFKDSDDFIKTLDDFMVVFNKNERNHILSYIKTKNLDQKDAFVVFDEDKVFNSKIIVQNQELSTEDKQIIISYLNKREIPLYKSAFGIASKMYLNNEFTLNNLLEDNMSRNKVKPIIIPNKKNNKKDAF